MREGVYCSRTRRVAEAFSLSRQRSAWRLPMERKREIKNGHMMSQGEMITSMVRAPIMARRTKRVAIVRISAKRIFLRMNE